LKILVVGGGGREHTLCWKLSQSKKVEKIYCVPGNAGIGEIAQCEDVEYERNFSSLAQFVKKEKIDFTIVGPEIPLVNGIVDFFQKKKLKIFGSSKKASALEGSKVFAKRFMKKYHIPTAKFDIFSDFDKAARYIQNQGNPQVIKVDGLAAGKGALVTNTKEEATEAARKVLKEKAFGEAGKKIVIEEKLKGEEVSFFVLADGKMVKPLVSSQDHKSIYEGDKGPNTGGMGAYSPAPLPPFLYKKVMKRIILPTLRGMEEEGKPYRGVLYVGLMIRAGEPKVLEFNARFGDPETQVTLPRLYNDLLEVLLATSDGNLDKVTLSWRYQAATCVILASKGYPDKYEKGKLIKGLKDLVKFKNTFAFYAGVRKEDGNLLTSGGRVVGITALGKNLKESTRQAYRGVKKIYFEGMYYRGDIGKRGC